MLGVDTGVLGTPHCLDNRLADPHTSPPERGFTVFWRHVGGCEAERYHFQELSESSRIAAGKELEPRISIQKCPVALREVESTSKIALAASPDPCRKQEALWC